MKRIFFAIAILPWILIGCTSVTFKEPQPANNKDLAEIPLGIRGHYFDYDRNNDLFITDNLIYGVGFNDDTISVNQLDKNEKIDGDSITNLSLRERYFVKRINDTLFTGRKYVDTIFNLKDNNCVLKSEGDDYFLNYSTEDHNWTVSKLSLRGPLINLSDIETENELRMMAQITNTPPDSIRPLIVKPTKDQFKQFVRQNGFINGISYLKIDSAYNTKL